MSEAPVDQPVDLPVGTVTLLFSDVAGSTRLLSRLGPAYVDALDGQRRVLRAAFTAQGGTELGTEGDSFFVVFPTAPAAVAAAASATRELAAYPWPEHEQVLVRMGIHTGSPTLHDGGYVGMDVHRAARIASAAHGGQVLLSDATAHLVAGELQTGVALVDLGVHRLKDLPDPERLFQLRLTGLPNEFPPLRSLGAASRLPAPASRLIGREQDIRLISRQITDGTTRLVTLTGPGGAGKTRLSIALAHELIQSFPDGVYFVPLAQVTEAAGMWAAIAEVLDVPIQSRTPPAVYEHLGYQGGLFVLDNLEQLPGADEVVAKFLAIAPRVVLVVTSRRPIHVDGEQEHAVTPLTLPDADGLEDVSSSDAVRLFVDRASRTRGDFRLDAENAAVVAAICRRLDGLPLAIELAAARTKVLSPHALFTRLDRALDLRAAGNQTPQRQRTLRTTIDWSYALLSPPLQALFRRLSVLSGGGDLAAVEALARVDGPAGALTDEDVLDLVAGLVDASLVTIAESTGGEPRVGLLQTMRAYALDRLASEGEEALTREAHAEYYMAIAERLSASIRGPQHRESRATFAIELDNLREALQWATEPSEGSPDGVGRSHIGLRLCIALSGYWAASGSVGEAVRWIARAVAGADSGDSGDSGDSADLARCLSQLGRFERMAGRIDEALVHTRAGVEMWGRVGPDPDGPAFASNMLGQTQAERGETQAALASFTQALALAREQRDLGQICSTLINYAFLMGTPLGDYQRALEMETEALAYAEELGDPAFVIRCLENAACSMRLLGRLVEARDVMRRLMATAFELDLPVQLAELAEDYAAVLSEVGDAPRAVWLFGAADADRERLGTPRSSMQIAELSAAIRHTHEQVDDDEWDKAYADGRSVTVQQAFARIEADERP